MSKPSNLMILLGLLASSPCRAELPPLDCVLEPDQIINISSAAEGLIEKVHVERNDTVEKGQILVELQSGVEQATLALAMARAAITSEIEETRANLALSKRRHLRVDQLYNQQVVSLEEKDQLATEYDLAQINVRQAADKRRLAALEAVKAEELLSLRTLRSPIDGVVVQRFRSEGEFANEEPLLRIAQLDPLRVEVIVPAELHGMMQNGMRAEVVLDSLHEGTYPATVTTVDRVVDAASGTFDVRLKLANPDYTIPPGLRCQVRFYPGAPAPSATVAGELQPNESQTNAAASQPRGESPSPSLPPGDHQPLPIVEAVVATTDPQPLDDLKEAKLALCRSVGPIESASRVEEITARLSGDVLGIQSRQVTESIVDGHLVLVAAGAKETTQDVLAKLSGVRDKFALTQGPYKGQISVGFYHQKSAAERRRMEIAELGVNVGIRTRIREEPRFWMDVEFPEGFSELSLLEAAREVEPTATVALGLCSTNHLAERTE